MLTPQKICLFFILSLIVYSNSFLCPFIFDDIPLVVSNPHIQSLWPINQVFETTEDTHSFLIRPLVTLSFAFNYSLSGLDVWSYHLFNLLVHVFSALVLYKVILATFILTNTRSKNKLSNCASGTALVTSLIWLVHPLQTESVTYISQRSQSLASLFYLLIFYSAIQLHQSEKRRWLFLSIVCGVLGALTKEIIVTAPLALVFYDRLFLYASYRELFKKRRSLYLGLILIWVVSGGFFSLYLERVDIAESFSIPLYDYLLTQGGVILHLIEKAFIPINLCFDYSWPVVTSLKNVGISCFVVLALLGGALWFFIKGSKASFLGILFFLLLAPTNSVLPLGSPIYEHYMYLPLVAIILLIILSYQRVMMLFDLKENAQRKIDYGLSAILILILSILTFTRNIDYQSTLSIWQDTVDKSPVNARAHDFLATAYRNLGELDKAIEGYQAAIKFNPNLLIAYAHLGNSYIEKERYDKAVKYFSELLKHEPHNSKLHYNLARAYAFKEMHVEAQLHFSEAVKIHPNNFDYQIGLALMLQKLGRYEDALVYYGNALMINPADVRLYFIFSSLIAEIPEDTLSANPNAENLMKVTNSVVDQLHLLALKYARAQDYERVLTCLDVGLKISKHLSLDDKVDFYKEEKEYYLKLKETQ